MKKSKEIKQEMYNPVIPITEPMKEETTNKNYNTYIVVRDSRKVSDEEYSDPKDSKAIAEKEFWQRIVNKHPDGSKIEIVQFDRKKHY